MSPIIPFFDCSNNRKNGVISKTKINSATYQKFNILGDFSAKKIYKTYLFDFLYLKILQPLLAKFSDFIFF